MLLTLTRDCVICGQYFTLRWRHNGNDSVSNHQPRDCFLNRLFRHRSTKTSKLRVSGLCVGNSTGTGEFPAQMASNAENVSIWWRHHERDGVSNHRRRLDCLLDRLFRCRSKETPKFHVTGLCEGNLKYYTCNKPINYQMRHWLFWW